MTQRAFVAVVPPVPVLAPLADQWSVLRAAYPGYSWIPPARWHVTLAFLGEVASGQRHRLAERLLPIASATSPFSARLSGTGAFPSAAHARVLWVGVESTQLGALAAAVREAARDARIALDTKAFTAHITMARSRRDVAPSDVPHLLRKLLVADGAAWQVSRLVLTESSGGVRPEYAELAAWPLTGPIGEPEL
ncbi:MAG: RNA 2',3'-cyclic phosphodiesterase [Mycobacteriales bacterium]